MSNLQKYQGGIQKVESRAITSGVETFLAEWKDSQQKLANVVQTQEDTLYAVKQLANQVEQLQHSQQQTVNAVDKIQQTVFNMDLKVMMPVKEVAVRDPNIEPLMYGFYITVGLVVIAFIATVLQTTANNLKQPSYQPSGVRYEQSS